MFGGSEFEFGGKFVDASRDLEAVEAELRK
jgi:hypothetical protein